MGIDFSIADVRLREAAEMPVLEPGKEFEELKEGISPTEKVVGIHKFPEKIAKRLGYQGVISIWGFTDEVPGRWLAERIKDVARKQKIKLGDMEIIAKTDHLSDPLAPRATLGVKAKIMKIKTKKHVPLLVKDIISDMEKAKDPKQKAIEAVSEKKEDQEIGVSRWSDARPGITLHVDPRRETDFARQLVQQGARHMDQRMAAAMRGQLVISPMDQRAAARGD